MKDRRRVALLAGRFTGRQANLALRHCQTRDRVHYQQHALALIAKVLRYREGDECRPDPQRGRPV
jgi:hypothetical protein